MTPRPVIWVTEPIHNDALALLRANADLLGPGEFPAERAADVTAVIVRAKPIDAALCARLPSLRIVGKHGAGLDNIDLREMRARGIEVMRAEGTNADSVADLAIAFAMMLLRSPDLVDRQIRAGEALDATLKIGFEVSERRVGILGMGAIGRAVAKRLSHGFGATISGYDPQLPAPLWPADVHRHSAFESLLTQSDLLFLHLPLLPETTNLITAEALALMPKGAILVNCARGGIVDEQALAGALASKHLAGAASDVFAQEPPSLENPLLAQGLRFIATPHLGASTHAGLRRTGMVIAQRVLAAFDDNKGSQT